MCSLIAVIAWNQINVDLQVFYSLLRTSVCLIKLIIDCYEISASWMREAEDHAAWYALGEAYVQQWTAVADDDYDEIKNMST